MDNIEQSRREFVKKFSLLTGSGLILGSAPWITNLKAASGKDNKSASDIINVGIIGVGSRGSKLLQHIQLIPNIKIIAVCDDYKPNYERAITLAEKTGKVQAFYDYRRLLDMKDLDAVVIATPAFLHPVITIDALKAGKHVFVEKAMGITIDDCKKMVETQRETGLCMQVGHQRMFDIKYLEALRRVRENEFGPITHIRTNWNGLGNWRRENVPPHLEKKLNWRIYKEFSLGLMGELASHQIQVANWFLDEIPEYVMASGSLSYWKDGYRNSPDHVFTLFKYPSGAHLEQSVIQTNWYYGLEEQIMGPKGNFELEAGRYISQTPPPPPGIRQLVTDIEEKVFSTIPIGGASWVVKSKSNLEGDLIVNDYPLPDSTTLQFEAFAQSIIDKKPITDIIEQGYYATVGAIMGQMSIDTRETQYMKDEYKI